MCEKVKLAGLLAVAGQQVFFWEYFGPMVIYPLFYYFRAEIYGKTFEPVLAQVRLKIHNPDI
jgi:hypothetical protein